MPQPWEVYQQKTPQVAKQPWENYGGKSAPEYTPDITRQVYQGAMNYVAKPINETINSVVEPVISGMAKIQEKPAQAIANVIDNTGVGQWVGDKLMNARDAIYGVVNDVNDLKQYNPNLASDLSALNQNFQLASNLPFVKPVAEATANVAGNQLSKIGQSVAKNADLASVKKQVTSETLKDFASQSYKAADNSGGIISPEFTNKWLDASAKVLPQTEEGKLYAGETLATQKLSNLNALRDKPLSFQGAEEIDKDLGGDISKAFRAGDNTEATRLMGIQDNLREAVQSLPETSEHVTQAKALFSAAKKQEDIENILKRAEGKAQPATIIKNGFNTLYNNPRRMRGYTEAEQELIKQAASGSFTADKLREYGNRLVGIITLGSGGGMANSMAASLAATASRNGATAMQAARAAKVSESIMQRPAVQKAIQGAVESGQLAPKFTALKALGVTMDKTGQLLRGGKPFTMKEAMQLNPSQGKAAIAEITALGALQNAKQKP
jgi:hypothetical protein